MQPSTGRQELKRLIETYAIRTRELSETIAMLGGHVAAGRKIDESLEEVKRVRASQNRRAWIFSRSSRGSNSEVPPISATPLKRQLKIRPTSRQETEIKPISASDSGDAYDTGDSGYSVYGVTAPKRATRRATLANIWYAPHRHTYIGCDSGHRLPYPPLLTAGRSFVVEPVALHER